MSNANWPKTTNTTNTSTVERDTTCLDCGEHHEPNACLLDELAALVQARANRAGFERYANTVLCFAAGAGVGALCWLSFALGQLTR